MRVMLPQALVDMRAASTVYGLLKPVEWWAYLLVKPADIRAACNDAGSWSDCTWEMLELALCFQRDPVLLEQLLQRYVLYSFGLTLAWDLRLELAECTTIIVDCLILRRNLAAVVPVLLLEALRQELVSRLRYEGHRLVHQPRCPDRGLLPPSHLAC